MDSKRDDVEMSSTAEYTISQACRFKAERDEARQRLQELEEWTEDLEDSYREAWEQLLEETRKAKRLGRLVWRLQNRLAKAHRRERNLRKGMRMWREKVISGPVHTVSAYDLLPEDDLQTLRWVREQGGLDVVKTHTELFQQLKGERDELRDLVRGYEKHGAYDLLPECERLILELWPRYEDGTLLMDSYLFIDHHGDVRELDYINMSDDNEHFTLFTTEGTADRYSRGERVKRPVPAGDGKPLVEGQTVWRIDTGAEYWVKRGQTITSDAVVIIRKTNCDCESEIVKASQLTHTKPEPQGKTCGDCRFWQSDPDASQIGVCWNSYAERDSYDSYEARVKHANACEVFEERGE